MPATIRLLAAALILAALTACGGSGDDRGLVDSVAAPTAAVATTQTTPLSYQFTEAGTYELTLTGDYTPATPVGADVLNAWFSFSGVGTIVSGDAEPNYVITSGDATVKVNQSITVKLTGDGPWQVQILTATGFSSGSLTGLTLQVRR